MKRSEALAPLSRDHQHALDAALRLRRADDASLDAAVGHFGRFFSTEGQEHFATEEELLLPALPADDPEWAPVIERISADHAAIRAAAASTLTVESARALGERLHDHVRFEERVAFEIAERRLAPEDLERVGAAIGLRPRRGPEPAE